MDEEDEEDLPKPMENILRPSLSVAFTKLVFKTGIKQTIPKNSDEAYTLAYNEEVEQWSST